MQPKLSGIYIGLLPERADPELIPLILLPSFGSKTYRLTFWRMPGGGVSWIYADDNAPPYVRPACLIVAASRYRRDGSGPWYAVACRAACVAFIGRDGALWTVACPGLSQALADWISGYGLGRLRRTSARDCGGVSVRWPAWPRGNRDLCPGHQCTGLDTVCILAPHPTR